MIRISPTFASTLVSLVLAGAIAGCGDTTPTPVTPVEVQRDMSPLSGNVTSIEDGLPIRSAEVVLVDGRSYTVAAGPVATDAAGHYSFPDPPVGVFYVFVFHSDFFIFDRSTPTVMITSDNQVRYDIRMTRSEIWNSRGYRISGIVRDEATRAPIAGAFVSGFFPGLLSHSFVGISFPDESITGEDGTFTLEAVGVFPGEGLFPFAVSKEGYRPFMSQPFPLPAVPDSIVEGVEVLLEQEELTASLRGRVLYEGSPVAGIGVALDFYDPSWQENLPGVNPWPPPAPGAGMRSGDPSEVPFLGRVSLTDADGWYAFFSLGPGLYTIEPAFLPDDGYVNRTTTEVMVSAGAGDSVIAPIALAKALKPLSPPLRGTIADQTPRFAWEAHSGAETYEFWFSLGQIAETLRPLETGPEAAFDLPDSLALPIGSNVHWWIEARRGGTLVGAFEESATFTVSPAGSD